MSSVDHTPSSSSLCLSFQVLFVASPRQLSSSLLGCLRLEAHTGPRAIAGTMSGTTILHTTAEASWQSSPAMKKISIYFKKRPEMQDGCTGALVGITDIAFVYPLAVLATRRESGMLMADAVKQGRFWAGGMTAGTLLVPYSMAVESLSRAMQRFSRGSGEATVLGDMGAAAATTVVVTMGLQPIEKKLVMDQMLQHNVQGFGTESGGAAKTRATIFTPMRELAAYQKQYGTKALFGGTVPLMLRELCYITAITVVNPLVTENMKKKWESGNRFHNCLLGIGGSLTVGAAAGMASAPFQTISAMMKNEVNRGRSFKSIWAEVFAGGTFSGIHRLWFGAATRSLRTGGACVLYTQYRALMTEVALGPPGFSVDGVLPEKPEDVDFPTMSIQ